MTIPFSREVEAADGPIREGAEATRLERSLQTLGDERSGLWRELKGEGRIVEVELLEPLLGQLRHRHRPGRPRARRPGSVR